MLGYGDCSDKSTLLKKLLGMCGVNQRFALVRGTKAHGVGNRGAFWK